MSFKSVFMTICLPLILLLLTSGCAVSRPAADDDMPRVVRAEREVWVAGKEGPDPEAPTQGVRFHVVIELPASGDVRSFTIEAVHHDGGLAEHSLRIQGRTAHVYYAVPPEPMGFIEHDGAAVIDHTWADTEGRLMVKAFTEAAPSDAE